MTDEASKNKRTFDEAFNPNEAQRLTLDLSVFAVGVQDIIAKAVRRFGLEFSPQSPRLDITELAATDRKDCLQLILQLTVRDFLYEVRRLPRRLHELKNEYFARLDEKLEKSLSPNHLALYNGLIRFQERMNLHALSHYYDDLSHDLKSLTTSEYKSLQLGFWRKHARTNFNADNDLKNINHLLNRFHQEISPQLFEFTAGLSNFITQIDDDETCLDALAWLERFGQFSKRYYTPHNQPKIIQDCRKGCRHTQLQGMHTRPKALFNDDNAPTEPNGIEYKHSSC